MNQPFEHALSTATVLDLLTSVLLWLEDVHSIGYAINDLKNGNLMMSRRVSSRASTSILMPPSIRRRTK